MGHKVQLLKLKLGFNHLITVDSVGTSGGLALFWHNDIDVNLLNCSLRTFMLQSNCSRVHPGGFSQDFMGIQLHTKGGKGGI